MWRAHGIPLAFPVAADFAGTAEVGELVRLNDDGEVTNTPGTGLYFPLIDCVQFGQEQNASVTVAGIGKGLVEDANGITVNTPLTVGANGKGLVATSDETKAIGYAMGTPKGNGDFIPYLLTPKLGTSQY